MLIRRGEGFSGRKLIYLPNICFLHAQSWLFGENLALNVTLSAGARDAIISVISAAISSGDRLKISGMLADVRSIASALQDASVQANLTVNADEQCPLRKIKGVEALLRAHADSARAASLENCAALLPPTVPACW
jgi:hypothetical protein